MKVMFFQSPKMKSAPFLSLSVCCFSLRNVSVAIVKGPHTRFCFVWRLVWSFFMVFTWLTKYVLSGEQELFLNN